MEVNLGNDLEQALYAPGDRVQVRVGGFSGHVRTPKYVQGKSGYIEVLYGLFRNPEELAYGKPGMPKLPLYRVRFEFEDLWPAEVSRQIDTICVDIYQNWLKPGLN